MSVGLLLVTHAGVGSSLLAVAQGIFGACPLDAETLEVANDAPVPPLFERGLSVAARLDRGFGVLLLTDLYGSTPANLAVAILERHERCGRARLLSGLNLPMLVRVLNYSRLDLDALVEKALRGGRDGVMPCGPRTPGY